MDTRLADSIRDTPAGREAQAILGKCVHCGFCAAACPTYDLLGDELDGPRGRIYLIKQVLEGKTATAKTRLHLDRCLDCRACETACPYGVDYSRLLDIGRQAVEGQVPRRGGEGLLRWLLKEGASRPGIVGPAVALGRRLRPLLPPPLAEKLPPGVAGKTRPVARRHSRSMLLLAGCVQPALAPGINRAAARIFDRLGISLSEAPKAGCCGALRRHLADLAGARAEMRRNIDAWWPQIEAGAEALVVTASGCGVQVRDYGRILADDPAYAGKAARISVLCQDPSEVLLAEQAKLLLLLAEARTERGRLAFHSPCTLQHGLKIRGVIEAFLAEAGYQLTPVADSPLCCGAAGAYSLFQPGLAGRLRDRGLAALGAGAPATIATANIGCLSHLQAGSALPVRHWLELMDEALP